VEKQKRKQEPNAPLINRIFGALLRAAWALLRVTFGGAWWMLSNGAKSLWSGSVWLVKLPYHLLRYLISGRVPRFENSRQEEIFWRIKRQYRRKRLFAFHTMAYIAGILFSIGLITNQYFYVLELMRRSDGWNYWTMYNQMLNSVGIGLGIWTLFLVFHFIFNRMGNEEDVAIGAALEHEYARSDYQAERYERLHEPHLEEETDYEDKPKRNHGVHS
jgi:hypothetical protein